MSGRLVGEVLHNAPTDLTALERLVLAAFAERARDGDRTCRRYSLSRLASDLGSSERGVRYALAVLVERGLVVRLIPSAAIHRGVTQEYYLPPLRVEHRDAVVRGRGKRDATLRAVDNPVDLERRGQTTTEKGEASFPPSVSTTVTDSVVSGTCSAAVLRDEPRRLRVVQ